MRSFTLALVFATVAFAPAIADGMKSTEPEKQASSTKDDGQPELPTPQSSVQVTAERGVRVWRPAQPAEDNGDQQQAQQPYYSQPSYAQPSYSQPSSSGYGGGSSFGGGGALGTNGIASNGAPAGPQKLDQAGAAAATATSSATATATVTVINAQDAKGRGMKGDKGREKGESVA